MKWGASVRILDLEVERERAEWRRRCEAVLPHIGRLRAEVWTGFPIENRERAGSPFEVDDYPGGPRPRVYCPGCGGGIIYRDEVPCSMSKDSLESRVMAALDGAGLLTVRTLRSITVRPCAGDVLLEIPSTRDRTDTADALRRAGLTVNFLLRELRVRTGAAT